MRSALYGAKSWGQRWRVAIKADMALHTRAGAEAEPPLRADRLSACPRSASTVSPGMRRTASRNSRVRWGGTAPAATASSPTSSGGLLPAGA